MKRGGLGRGLAALLPTAGVAEEGELREVPVGAIAPNPRQPRREFVDESLDWLARSIQEVGILQPLVVRARGGEYELIAGERRLRAARIAGLATVPVIVREAGDTESLRGALIENLHREDLSALELAAAFAELLEELGASQDEVAARLGYSRAHVANTIRLLSLPGSVQRLLAEGRIQPGHARALLGLADEEAMASLGLRAAAEGLSVRAVEELVRTYTSRPVASAGERAPVVDPGAREAEDQLTERLGTRVRVSMGRRRGRIVIELGSRDDLDRVLGLITG
ncbi:MAG: ParB/RepB/Spo0J family partition protein [Actinobacteria bacterium]|nr:MAG: ParB/RepB/Spo0J family partition protein [Actinomycetota bacterium]